MYKDQRYRQVLNGVRDLRNQDIAFEKAKQQALKEYGIDADSLTAKDVQEIELIDCLADQHLQHKEPA
jgi:hypothetical protein